MTSHLLASRLRGPVTVVRLLGDGLAPEPPGLPPRRLYARDDETAGLLAEGRRELGLAGTPESAATLTKA